MERRRLRASTTETKPEAERAVTAVAALFFVGGRKRWGREVAQRMSRDDKCLQESEGMIGFG